MPWEPDPIATVILNSQRHWTQQIKTRIFATDDVREIVRQVGIDRLLDETIESFANTLGIFDDDRYQVPVRDGFHYLDPHMGLLEWMPALEMGRRATVKLVGYHTHNRDSKRLPTILSAAFSLDTGSGHLLAIIDGTFPTALRTGAASAVASRILAVPDTSVLGIIDCGAQAVAQLHALARMFPLERVLVYDIDADTGHSFVARRGSRPRRRQGHDCAGGYCGEVESHSMHSDVHGGRQRADHARCRGRAVSAHERCGL